MNTKHFTVKDVEKVISLMKELADYFSPETIAYAEKQLHSLKGLLIFNEEICIGFIIYGGISETSAKIYRMGISPAYQHQGLGSRLLEETEKNLIEGGFDTVELLTLDEHPEYPGYAITRKFYDKWGFIVESSFEEEGVTILKMRKGVFSE